MLVSGTTKITLMLALLVIWLVHQYKVAHQHPLIKKVIAYQNGYRNTGRFRHNLYSVANIQSPGRSTGSRT